MNLPRPHKEWPPGSRPCELAPVSVSGGAGPEQEGNSMTESAKRFPEAACNTGFFKSYRSLNFS